MRTRNLIDLTDNPNLISGIHNYCDRWCERCPLTARCLVYDAACSHALAGEKDAAFASLDQALSLGYGHVDHVLSDGDLESLHSDPRWKATVDRMLALHPEAPYQRLLEDQSKSVPARYLPVRHAFTNGLKAPSPSTRTRRYRPIRCCDTVEAKVWVVSSAG